MNEFYNENNINDEYFESMLEKGIKLPKEKFDILKKTLKDIINSDTIDVTTKKDLVTIMDSLDKGRADLKLPELLIDFLAEIEEPKRSLLEEWFYSCCNCRKHEFQEIESYTNDFLNKNSYSRHSIRKIINSIKQYRAERGL